MEKVHRPSELPWIDERRVLVSDWIEAAQRAPLVQLASKKLKQCLEDFFGDALGGDDVERLANHVKHLHVRAFCDEDAAKLVADAHEQPSSGGVAQPGLADIYQPSQRKAKKAEKQTAVDLRRTAVLTVQVFRPLFEKKALHQFSRVPCADQVLHVLSSQRLSELRDAIVCASDLVPLGEFSCRPQAAVVSVGERAMSALESEAAFLFVDGVFYNDTRNRLSTDLSE